MRAHLILTLISRAENHRNGSLDVGSFRLAWRKKDYLLHKKMLAETTGVLLEQDKEINEQRPMIRMRPGYLAKWVEF